eukprot:Hpha_TRINITY_DN16022_c5_g1::TRINITY_DN16022_c5_g1_i1::g.118686::m.118686/K04459/DUSP, MKP; dual specificity MAP kinase phosphatase
MPSDPGTPGGTAPPPLEARVETGPDRRDSVASSRRRASTSLKSSTLESPVSRSSERPARGKQRFRGSIGPLRPVDKCVEGTGSKAPKEHKPGEIGATQVVPWLFLGGAADAVKADELKKRGISRIVNLTPESKVERLDGVEYLQVEVIDHSDSPIRCHFERVIAFLEAARKDRVAVLVHCRQGVSRSATVTIAYIMSVLRVPYLTAFDAVKRKRDQINPNLGFVSTLQDYEAELHIDDDDTAAHSAALASWGLESHHCTPGLSPPESPSTPASPFTAPAFSSLGFS